MRIPRLRFNPKEQATGDNDSWSEIADRLVNLILQGKDLTPKKINKEIDDIDGLITFDGNSITLLNEDGDLIVRDRGSRSESLGAVIRKLGRITKRHQLENYYVPKKYHTGHIPKHHQSSHTHKPKQMGLWGGDSGFSSGSSYGGSWKSKKSEPYIPPPPKLAFGGVVIRDDGMVMVVEPANHWTGVIWTMPKGGIDEGETPEECALREVWEETGWHAEILGKIDGKYKGTASITEYFLMKPIGVQGDWQFKGTKKEETWRVEFVPYECARLLVSSSHKLASERDVSVLDKGYKMWLKLKRQGI
jgi:8-oxo-dGTP pyrophosphatase MutT (NUDIX family)